MNPVRTRLRRGWWAGSLALLVLAQAAGHAADAATEALAREVAGQGWILFTARSEHRDYDLFVCRPDGSDRRNLTRTPDTSEYGVRLSPDGKRMLYRRQPKGDDVRPGEGISHDQWGAQGVLVIANADGSDPQPQGGDGAFPWASWSPDGRQLACLYKREGRIRLFDLATKRPVKELPRQGIFQQLFWSPDGRRLCGTANLNGQDWNVVSLDLESGQLQLLSRALNCTPDWFHRDAGRVIYSNRTPGLGNDYGWTMVMQATADGKSRTLVYGERGRHVYYGTTSPDDRYALFALPESDGGTDAEMAIVRLADTPIVVPADYRELQALYPDAKPGPVWRLPHPGFEPEWTLVDFGGRTP